MIKQALLAGKNVTIFAYGQTSSGKTFTMRGDNSKEGFIPLALKQIFSHFKELAPREKDEE